MMRRFWFASLALVASGCQTQTCDGGDFDCVMEHLSIRIGDDDRPRTRIEKNRMPSMASLPVDGSDGFQLELVPLSVPNWGNPVELMQSGMVGVSGGSGDGAAPAPTLSSPSVKLSLSSPDDEQTVMLSFVDPNGETPAICARLVDPKGLSGPYFWCPDGPKRDLQSFGIVPIRIRFNAFVDHSTINFGTASKIEPSPIVPTPIVPSPLQTLPPLPPTVGVPVRWPFVPPAPPTSAPSPPANDPTRIGNFTACASQPFSCSDNTVPSPCTTLKFCASGNSAGGCTGAWFTFDANGNTREFDCSCTDQCIGAAMAATSGCCPKK